MDDEPLPATLRQAIVDKGCQYLRAIERRLDPQNESETAPTNRPRPKAGLIERIKQIFR